MGLKLKKQEVIKMYSEKETHFIKQETLWNEYKKEREAHFDEEIKKFKKLPWYKQWFAPQPLLRESYGFNSGQTDIFFYFLRENEFMLRENKQRLTKLRKFLDNCNDKTVIITDKDIEFLREREEIKYSFCCEHLKI